MTLEALCKNMPDDDFLSKAIYFGISLDAPLSQKQEYQDLERFFLRATYNLSNSRITEGEELPDLDVFNSGIKDLLGLRRGILTTL